MAASKLINNLDLNQMHKKIPPLEPLVPRKPKKLLMTDSLVAPIEKIDVPNHILNTSLLSLFQNCIIFF
jgi:hypothetical protein